MNTTGEKAFGSKIFTILKMGVFKSCSNSKVKKKKKKTNQNPNNPGEGQSHWPRRADAGHEDHQSYFQNSEDQCAR